MKHTAKDSRNAGMKKNSNSNTRSLRFSINSKRCRRQLRIGGMGGGHDEAMTNNRTSL